MTGYELMEEYLLTKVDTEITQLQIQRELDEYQRRHNKNFLPESLSRYFRFVRDGKRLENKGYEIVEVTGRKHLTFKVRTKDLTLFKEF
jgi:hypothetical protein